MSDIPASFTASWQEAFIENVLDLPAFHSPLLDELWRQHVTRHVGARATRDNAVLKILHEHGAEA